MRLDLILLQLGLASIFAACCDGQEPSQQPLPPKAGDLVIEPATVKPAGIDPVAFALGALVVPENRAEKDSRLIRIGFARFKAETSSEAPPIFLLPGGPGDSLLNDLDPNNVSLGLVREIQRYRQMSDVVLIDQRGFSRRGDVLMHRFRTTEEPLDRPASLEHSSRVFSEMAQAAVKEYEGKGIDLRGYTVKECADDVDALRNALGYSRIMLVGGSFGSQWSFAVMRRHPDSVARALLTDVEPLNCGYDMPSHVLAAVQRRWWEAERDEGLQPYLPPGGLMAAAREVLSRLEREPVRVPLKDIIDPKTGAEATITLGREDFQRSPALRGPAGPAFVLSLYHRHYNQWALDTYRTRLSRSVQFPLIAALVDTSLGVTPERLYLLRNDPAIAVLGQWNFNSYLASADIWPSPDVGDDFRNEVACSIPVVFVHGTWDTNTPVENVLQVAPYFRKGYVLLVERADHGVMNYLTRSQPKIRRALFDFLKDGDATNLPTHVAVPAPKFDAPDFAPPTRSENTK